MKSNHIRKVLLLVAITILLVGLASAATTNKTSTTKDTKIVKDTTITSVKTATTKTLKEPAKKVTNNNVTKKKIENNKVNQTKKTSSYTTSVSNFKQLANKLDELKHVNYEKYTINLNKGDYNVKSNDYEECIRIGEYRDEKTEKYITPVCKNVVINGNSITIKGNNKDFLQISSDYSLTLNNITLKNFNLPILNSGNLTTHNVKFINNKETSIENYGTSIIYNSYFINNTSEHGGAINTQKGYSIIINSKFINNTANTGGAILNGDYSTLDVYNCEFENNKADRGGAIYNWGYSLNITNSQFKNNQAKENGGAIFILSTDNGNKLISNNIFTKNLANTTGNAIKIVDVNNPKISDNTNAEKSKYSSTIYSEGWIEITNNRFKDKADTKLTIKLNNTKAYKASKVKATITLKDDENNVLKNQKIKIKFGTQSYTIKTNAKGIATKTYKTTKTGNIKVTASYAETTNYYKTSTSTKMKVLPKIKTKLTLKLSKKKVKVKDKIKVTVTLKNKSNKAIKSQKVAIKIGSKTYTKKTNKKGTITLTYKVVKSALGKAIKATYKGSYMYLSSKVSKKLLKA